MIYFYPVDWVADPHNDRLAHGDVLHGLSRNYFYICEIDPKDQLNLGAMTVKQVRQIAQKNGFLDLLRSGWEQRAARDGHANAAWEFWFGIKGAVSKGKLTWSQALKGFKSVVDYTGTIHPHEFEQLFVRDRSVMRVVAFEANKDVSQNQYTVEYWKPVVLKIFNHLAQKYHGKVYWTDKQPRVAFIIGDTQFIFGMNDYSALQMVMQQSGGPQHFERLDDIDLDEMSVEAAISEFEDIIDSNLTRKAA